MGRVLPGANRGRKTAAAHAPAESRLQPRLAAPQVFHGVSRAEGPSQQTANFRQTAPEIHVSRIMRKSLIRGNENRGRVAVNPVTDGAGSGFRKDGGTHASLVCHRGRLAFSRESPVCGCAYQPPQVNVIRHLHTGLHWSSLSRRILSYVPLFVRPCRSPRARSGRRSGIENAAPAELGHPVLGRRA